MPTGYTAPLYEGKEITFEQFVMRCARAMGAAIMQRDESPDAEIRMREVEPWYAERLRESQEALRDAARRTPEEWAAHQAERIAADQKAADEYAERVEAIAARYVAMLDKVLVWTPPTAEHEGLKKFMVDQLDESLRFDAGDWRPAVLEHLPVDEYRDKQIAAMTQAVEREHERLRAEKDRVRSQNAWVTALRDSLTSEEVVG